MRFFLVITALLFFVPISGIKAQNGLLLQPLNESSIAVFPNPATDYFIVNSSNEQIVQIILYNIYGEQIFKISKNIQNQQIFMIDAYTPGVYILKIRTRSQDVIRILKIE